MEKIFLIDAYALIYRSYYALIKSPRINSKGLNTSAIMGFVNTLNEVLTKENPTHIAVAFDHGLTFRNIAYPPYKAQREETPEVIRMSIPIIKDILTAWHIPILQVDGYEADDIIGTIVSQTIPTSNEESTDINSVANSKENAPALSSPEGRSGGVFYMLTPDKDYGQLVRPNVFMYKPAFRGGYDILGEKEICEKYSISSANHVIDLLALMGDTADNFPGCPGVGEKTAVKLINEYGTCEDIISNRMAIKGALGKKVQEHVDDIVISKYLARIATDIPMTDDDDTASLEVKDGNTGEMTTMTTGTLPSFPTLLRMMQVQEPDRNRLSEIFAELEFRQLAQKILGTTAVSGSNSSTSNLANGSSAKVSSTSATTSNLMNGNSAAISSISAQNTPNAKKSKNTKKEDKNQLSFFDLFAGNDAGGENEAVNHDLENIPHEYKLIDNLQDAQSLCDFLLTKQLVCFDTETTSKSPIEADLVGMSFCVEEGKAFFVCLRKEVTSQESLFETEQTTKYIYSPELMKEAAEVFRPLFESESIAKVGQNIKYDMQILMKLGINVRGTLYDTMIAHYLIQPELRHGMDYMAETILKYNTIHYDEIVPREKTMADISPADICDYACEDADVTLKLWHHLEPRLHEQPGLWQLFTELEMPLVEVLADMELTGVAIDNEAMGEVSRLFNSRMIEHERKIYELAGRQFNINSPRQVGDILFGEMKIIEKPKKTKTGQYVTSEEVLQQLRGEHEIVAEILDYRGLKKLVGTYVDALPKLVNKKTQRIHTSFNQCVTATGRLSSSDPNLQNIPVRGEDGKEIRKCFKAPLFFSADYSQIELRIMAHLSQDEAMIEAFRNGHDVHATTAATVYDKAVADVTRDERTKAKRANFGLIYGISSWGLSQSLHIDRKEAKSLMDGFFQTFPKVQEYMELSKRIASENGYASTLLQRRRYLPDINSGNATVRGIAERNAINAPIQGTAADIIKIAMIRIFRRFREEHLQSKMILQVHDELNFSVVPEEKEIVEQIVIQEMQNALPLSVPLTAECGWGTNWLEAH